MPLPTPVNGRSAGDTAADCDPVDLATKPVLEWTADDWARWAEGAAGPAVAAFPGLQAAGAPEPEAAGPPEPEAAGPPEPEPPVAEPKRWYPPPPAVDPELDPVAVAVTTEAPDEAATWWTSRPAPGPVPAPPPPPRTVPPQPRAASRTGRPAHRRQAPAAVPVERRLRAAAGLLLTSVVVGAVLASLLTVALFVTTLVLQGLTG